MKEEFFSFFNAFHMSRIKRFYIIKHPTTDIIRAWQGHQYEQKWFCVLSGSFSLVVVQSDDFQKPSKKSKRKVFHLSAGNPEVLHVPGSYATGFRALEQDTKRIVFSNVTVKKSQSDGYRFDKNLWSDVWRQDD